MNTDELSIIPTTLEQAAHRILAARLDDMAARWDALNLDDTETVKKLRVAMRRLRAAVSAFKPLYPRKSLNPVRDQLRSLTTALGAARDAAVLQQRLEQWAVTDDTAPALAPLHQRLAQQQAAAQEDLRATLAHLSLDQLIGDARAALLEALPPPPDDTAISLSPSYVSLHLAILPLVRARFDDELAARHLAIAEPTALNLHNARLAVKRLRYTLELFADILPPAPATIAMLKQLQTQLGDLHDADVLIDMVGAAGDNAGLTEARGRLDQRRAKLLADHLAYRAQIDAGEWATLADDWRTILDRQPGPTPAELAAAADVPLDDWPHARQVLRLALSIYDQLGQPPDPRARDILATAALLHDAGMVDGPQQHHIRSYQIIRRAKLEGLNKRERLQVALIARYHRRTLPHPEHKGYAALTPRQQRRVTRLAAILRVADGLDYDHDGAAHALSFDPATLCLQVEGATEAELARARVKADLFPAAFGRGLMIVDCRLQIAD